MALKLFITAEEYAGLPDALKENYTQEGEKYRLKVEDDKGDIYAALKAKDKILEEKKAESERRRLLEEELAALKRKEEEEERRRLEEAGKYEEVLKRIEAEKEAKLKELEARAEQEREARRKMLVDLKVKEVATALAGERAALLEPHLRNRFTITERDGKEEVVIVDPTGVPNPAMTVEKLMDEFRANPLFAPAIVGRDSNGGGTPGGNGGSAGEEWSKYFDRSNPAYSISKQIELEEQNPALYNELVKKFGLDDPYGQAG
jgi:multidrug efflux pump subunit AcrA (membrane-fusion protein)